MQSNNIVDESKKNDDCSCDNTESDFFQAHGCCEYCFFIG